MTSVAQVFAVPVARDDYCERDTLEMALDALQVLDRTCNEVFTRVEQKIDEASSKLTTANERIEAARFRVKKITGVSSATTIFSKPTYPTGPECSTYEPVLSGLGFTDVAEPFEEDEEAPPFEVEGKGTGSNPAELRQLYKSVNPDLSFTELGQKPGLGRLPKRLPSVSSMLLFNSTATPYKQYSTINTLLGEDFASREEDDDNYEMEHAPDTFMNDQDDNGVQTVDFGFVPAAVELDMSSLNFMDNLSLPGIADNVNYQSAPEGLQSFAPSILKNEQGAGFLALEDLSMPGIDPGPGGMPPPAATTTAAAAPPPPPQGGAAAASPPPPPPGTYSAPAPAAAAVGPPPPPGGGGMPPPPPGGGTVHDEPCRLACASERLVAARLCFVFADVRFVSFNTVARFALCVVVVGFLFRCRYAAPAAGRRNAPTATRRRDAPTATRRRQRCTTRTPRACRSAVQTTSGRRRRWWWGRRLACCDSGGQEAQKLEKESPCQAKAKAQEETLAWGRLGGRSTDCLSDCLPNCLFCCSPPRRRPLCFFQVRWGLSMRIGTHLEFRELSLTATGHARPACAVYARRAE